MISRIVVVIVLVISMSPETESNELINSYCQDNAYDPNVNTTYRTNLNTLLSTLSEASRTKDFYRFQAGKDTSEPTYGLYLCRGDVSLESCHSCVQNAWTDILISCPNQTVAVVWYDICMLRYSYQYIAYSVQARNFLIWHDKNDVRAGEVAVFNRTLNEMMDKLKTRAAEDKKRSGKKFATQEGNYSGTGKLYTLAQCTPDLSTDDCEYCLTKAIEEIPVCCNGKQGGGAASESCNIRFETYAYYAIADNAPSPAPLPSDDVANNPTAPITSGKKGKSISVPLIIAIIVVSIIVSIVLFVLAFRFLKKRSKETYGVVADGEDMSAAIDSIHYSFSEIQAATNNFSTDHKIGEGGFGPVYKGTLPNGQEIAVKRLSRTSVQGFEEFKNEILLLAKLQHRNLVRLLGFSSQGEEKILIYEFVPNKSLDYFIFDGEKQDTLDWPRRQKIIVGIAKGMLYLHEDSRLKIIHRDLKASNILLDANMNPKIADFGMARIFRDDESEGKTSKIAGTQGYMPPEYVVHGQFSVKSDVYSFGVLVLEIISRKRNSNFYRLGLGENSLLSYAWNNWKNGTPLALLDPVDEHLGDSNYSRNEILNCIQVGLLCVQEDVEQRPTMASVVPMLSSGSITVPAAPRHPAFFADSKKEPFRPGMDMEESDKSTTTTTTTKSVSASVNETLITELYPR